MTAESVPIPRRPLPGTELTLSEIALEVVPPAFVSPAGEERTIALLRRARAAGVTAFEIPDGATGRHAERLFTRAFDRSDSSPLAILRRSPASLESALGTASKGDSAAVRLRSSLRDVRRRLGTSTELMVHWADEPAVAYAVPELPDELDRAQAEGDIDGWVRALGSTNPEAVPSWKDPSPRSFSGAVSLLDTRLVPSIEARASRSPTGFLALDPLASGRLDGSRFARTVADRRPDDGPVTVRELRKEFDPVLRLGFLTTGKQRTLAQASIRFVLDVPGVSAVLLPLPSPERFDELIRSGTTPSLTDRERDLLGAQLTGPR